MYTLFSKKAPAEKAAPTMEHVKGLRRRTEEIEIGPHVQKRFLLNLLNTIRYAALPKPKRRKLDCKVEGHILPRHWRYGDMPRCVDCGSPIKDPKELRHGVSPSGLK